jgi:hypothetical protein
LADTNAAARAAAAAATGDFDGARGALLDIAWKPHPIPPRPSIPKSTYVRVYTRDGWRCRIAGCRRRLIFEPVIRLLGDLFSDLVPYDSGLGWQCHPLGRWCVPALDDRLAHTLGGSSKMGNLLTLCSPCNTVTSNWTLEELGAEVMPGEPAGDWDGLTGIYEALWEVAERPSPTYHRAWLRALAA